MSYFPEGQPPAKLSALEIISSYPDPEEITANIQQGDPPLFLGPVALLFLASVSILLMRWHKGYQKYFSGR